MALNITMHVTFLLLTQAQSKFPAKKGKKKGEPHLFWLTIMATIGRRTLLAAAACATLFLAAQTATAVGGGARCLLEETVTHKSEASTPSPLRGLRVVARSRPALRVALGLFLTTTGLLSALSIVTTWGISALGLSQSVLALAVLTQQVGTCCPGWDTYHSSASVERRPK